MKPGELMGLSEPLHLIKLRFFLFWQMEFKQPCKHYYTIEYLRAAHLQCQTVLVKHKI